MQKLSLVAGTLLVLAPVALLLPGCGGSSSGDIVPTATPGATATGTTNPTSTALPTGTTTPTNTPRPTSTLFPAGPDDVKPHLTYTASSDSNFVQDQPYYASIYVNGTPQSVTLTFATSGYARIDGILKNAKRGKTYTPTSSEFSMLPVLTNIVGTNFTRRLYTFQGGQIKVTALQKRYSELTFVNAVFAPKVGGGANGAKGTVTVNGTLSGGINGDIVPD